MEPGGVDDLGERLVAEYNVLEAGAPCQYEAWEEMRALAQESDPRAAWRIVQEVLPRLSDQQIGYLAAGPEEDLIDFHWRDFESAMAALAESSPRFREALACTRPGPWVPDDVRRRFEDMGRS